METSNEECSATSSCHRLRRLQEHLRRIGCDALLLVAGPDGRYNLGSHQALGYLLQSRSGRDVLDSARLAVEYEDSFAVVRQHSIHLYCPASARQECERLLLSGCDNVQIVTPTVDEDKDTLDDFKVAAFVQLFRKCSNVAVLLPVEIMNGVQRMSDVHEIDTWPLVQAYGSEAVGRPGCFTLNFKVSDATSGLQQLYGELDRLALLQLVTQRLEAMRRHWADMVKTVYTCPLSKRCSDLTERTVAGPLIAFFHHAMLRHTQGVRQVATMKPRVVYGARTNDPMAETGDVTAATICISRGFPAVHAVAEAADPRSPIRVARTIFLSHGELASELFIDDEELADSAATSSVASWSNVDVVMLMRLYVALVAAARCAMEHFATQEGATVATARAAAEAVFQERSAAHGVSSDLTNFHLVLWSADHANNVTPIAQRGTRQLKVLRVTLTDICSTAPQHPGTLLGSLVYADTFLEIPAFSGRPAALLTLTHPIPATLCCAVSDVEATRAAAAYTAFLQRFLQRRQQQQAPQPPQPPPPPPSLMHRSASGNALRNNKKGKRVSSGSSSGTTTPNSPMSTSSGQSPRIAYSLGDMLSSGGADDPALLLTDCTITPVFVGTICFFPAGFAFMSRNAPGVPIFLMDLRLHAETVCVMDILSPCPDLPDLGEAVVIRGKRPACGLSPACLLTNNPAIALPLSFFSPTGNLRRHILAVVLPAWQQTCREAGVPWVRAGSALSPLGARQYPKQWLALAERAEGSPQRRLPLAMVEERAEELMARLDEQETASHWPLNPVVEAFLVGDCWRRAPGQNCVEEPSTKLTLVTGVPGADQSHVVAVLASVIGSSQCIRIVTVPEPGAVLLSAQYMNQALGAALADLSQSGGERHLLLLASCFDSVPAQISMLAQCEAARHCRLASVVCCVPCEGLWEDDGRRQPLPGLVEQLAAGYVDALVLGPGRDVDEVRRLVQLRCPDTPQVRGSWSALVQARDVLQPGREERAARLASSGSVAARHAAQPAFGSPLRDTLLGPLTSSRAVFEGCLDMQRFVDELVLLGLCEDAAERCPLCIPLQEVPASGSQPPVMYSATALVRPSNGAPLQEVVAQRHASVRVHQWPMGLCSELLQAPPAIVGGDAPGGEVVLVGCGGSSTVLLELLGRCQVATADHAGPQARSPSIFNQQEQEGIRQQHMHDAVPEGYYFTGGEYADPYGTMTPMHPNLAHSLQQDVAQLNSTSCNGVQPAAAQQLRVVQLTSQ